MDELVEERPVPGAVVRHRGARVEEHGVDRSAPRLEVHSGVVWLRATDAGPGLLVNHGATTVQVREGAAVLEISDFEALLVVVAGRAAVKGAAALPRSVTSGHAVVLNLDGGFGTPEPLSPAELQADRFVVENLARDVLAEAVLGPEPVASDESTPAGAPAPPSLSAPVGARVDGTPPSVGDVPAAFEDAPPPVGAGAGLDEEASGGEVPPPAEVIAPDPVPSSATRDETESTAASPPRRGLVAMVLVLVLLAAIIGAVVMTKDEPRSAPVGEDVALASEPVVATSAHPEAVLQVCQGGVDGYRAQGVVSGGEPGVARYEVGVGLEDSTGALYAERTIVVDARADPSVAVQWSAELASDTGGAQPGAECRITRVDALR